MGRSPQPLVRVDDRLGALHIGRMILREASWLSLLVSTRGTVLSRIWLRIVLITLVALVITWLHLEEGWFERSLTPLPFTLIGLALGIFLGFRNNTSYDRFWEGRKLWGALVNASRSLTRQILTLIDLRAEASAGKTPDPVHRELVHRHIAYVHCLRHHLRDQREALPELSELLSASELSALEAEHNRPVALLQWQADRFVELFRNGSISEYHLPVLEASLTELTGIQGGCERIKSTPIPYSYTVLIHRLVAFYCFALPFGIADAVGMFTPLVALMVSYAFLGLDAIGDEIEEPFGLDVNDLPLTTLSRMIEVNLRQRLGEHPLPPLMTAEDGWPADLARAPIASAPPAERQTRSWPAGPRCRSSRSFSPSEARRRSLSRGRWTSGAPAPPTRPGNLRGCRWK
ncbi:MAG: bestrophin family ion channel [Myxococcales bacterium]|nr:bestrophin family ion channel [Myxococcales bacterium]